MGNSAKNLQNEQGERIPRHPDEFEALGYEIRITSFDDERARERCAVKLQAFNHGLEPQLTKVEAEIAKTGESADALRDHLYHRPMAVNEATMHAQASKLRILMVLAALASLISIAGNMITFALFGYAALATLGFALGMTAGPVVVGYFAYEHLLARYRRLRMAITVASLVLFALGFFELAQARRLMLERIAHAPAPASYVDNGPAVPQNVPAPAAGKVSEAHIRRLEGDGLLSLMIAADLLLGFLVGEIAEVRADEDFAAWKKLQAAEARLMSLAVERQAIFSRMDIAKTRCIAGFLRAQEIMAHRKPRYPRTPIVIFATLGLLTLHSSTAYGQRIKRDEAVLIDTSASIKPGLFRQYIAATEKLLATAPSNTRVLVFRISGHSFGDEEILSGWTPGARGVFTDALNRARRQLVAAFASKAVHLAPTARNTDIFGALARVKVEFGAEAGGKSIPKTVWIFSDMVNDTQEFPMPKLLQLGPRKMLQRARIEHLMLHLEHFSIRVQGASTAGLTPLNWLEIRKFWQMYFAAAGAQLVFYSPES